MQPMNPNRRLLPHNVAGSGHSSVAIGPGVSARVGHQTPARFAATPAPARAAARNAMPVFVPEPVVMLTPVRTVASAPRVVIVPGSQPPPYSVSVPASGDGRHYSVGGGSLALIILGIFLAIVGLAEPTGVLFGIGVGTALLGTILQVHHHNRDSVRASL